MHISSLKIVKSFINIDYILNCGYCQVPQKYALNLDIRDPRDHGCSLLSNSDSMRITLFQECNYENSLSRYLIMIFNVFFLLEF